MATVWLATDLDGTISGAQGIAPGTASMLTKASQAGIWVILASGRRPEHVRQIGQQLHLHAPFIALDGALVEVPGQKVFRTCPMDARDVDALCATAEDLGLKPHRIGEHGADFKVVLTGPLEKLEKLFHMGASAWPRLREVNRFARQAEWVRADCSKGRALVDLSLCYGRPDRIIAFGNDWNDREMFEVADLAYALPSAPAPLQALADQVLGPVEEEPVAQIIASLLHSRVWGAELGSSEH